MTKKAGLWFFLFLILTSFCYAQENVVGKDGCVDVQIYNKTWQKYSDFNNAISPGDRNWNVQQWYALDKEIKLAQADLAGIKSLTDEKSRAKQDQLNQQIREARKKQEELVKEEYNRTLASLNKNCRKGLLPGLAVEGPTKLTVGKKATYKVKIPQGYEGYTYRWVTESGNMLTGEHFITYSSSKEGMHRLSVEAIDPQTQKVAGMVAVNIEVVKDNESESLSKKVYLKIDEFTVNPKRAIQGDKLNAEVVFTVSGLADLEANPNSSRQTYVVFHYSGKNKSYKEEYPMFVHNGTFPVDDDHLNTAAWPPGIYTVRVTVDLEDGPGGTLTRNFKILKKPNLDLLSSFTIKAPSQVAPGEVAVLTVIPSDSSQHYFYKWFAPDGSELTGQKTQTARYQPKNEGTHTLRVMIYDETGENLLAKKSISLNVVKPSEAPGTSSSSGLVRMRLHDFTIRNDSIIPGEAINADFQVDLSGIRNASNDPHSAAKLTYTCEYSGNGKSFPIRQDVLVANGTSMLSCAANPSKDWPPGRYDLLVTAEVSGARVSAKKSFTVRQPDIMVQNPSAPLKIRIKVHGIKVEPSDPEPGSVIKATVDYTVLGISKGTKSPISIQWTFSGNGLGIKKEWKGETPGGKRSAWYKIKTTGWPPGSYTIFALITVGGAQEEGDEIFALYEPRPQTTSSTQGGNSSDNSENPGGIKIDPFLGDWEGQYTFVEDSSGSIQIGTKVPVHLRITSEEDGYHAYNTDDPDAVNPPLKSKIENGQLVFYYSGPAIDTSGYAHEDHHVEIYWAIGSDGTNLSGRLTMIFDRDRTVVDVQTTRAR